MEREAEGFNAWSWGRIIQRSSVQVLVLNGLMEKGHFYESKEKQSEVEIEIRIMFFHFVPDISINIELFSWEIMMFLLKIHKMLVCQNIRLILCK